MGAVDLPLDPLVVGERPHAARRIGASVVDWTLAGGLALLGLVAHAGRGAVLLPLAFFVVAAWGGASPGGVVTGTGIVAMATGGPVPWWRAIVRGVVQLACGAACALLVYGTVLVLASALLGGFGGRLGGDDSTTGAVFLLALMGALIAVAVLDAVTEALFGQTPWDAAARSTTVRHH